MVEIGEYQRAGKTRYRWYVKNAVGKTVAEGPTSWATRTEANRHFVEARDLIGRRTPRGVYVLVLAVGVLIGWLVAP